MLQHVRDEAHRFAITYHRTLRGKHMSETALMQVPGIGRAKADALIKEFGSAENVKHAEPERIARLHGFTVESAKRLLDALNLQNSAVDVHEESDKTAVCDDSTDGGKD